MNDIKVENTESTNSIQLSICITENIKFESIVEVNENTLCDSDNAENIKKLKSASKSIKLETVLEENQSTLPKDENTQQMVSLLNDVKIFKDKIIPTSSNVFHEEVKAINEKSPTTLTLDESDNSKIRVCCRFCKKGFKTIKIFKNHDCRNSKSSCSEVEIHKCKFCSLTFSYKQHLTRHLKGHKRNNCTLCNAQFTKRKALCKHLRTVHDVKEPEKLHKCSFCDKHFAKRLSLNFHLKTHIDNKYFCLKCCFLCDDEDTYNDHVKKHIKISKHECNLCQKKFVRRQQYDQHMMAHERHLCSSCNITFSNKKLFLKHQQSVHHTKAEKKYACLICEKLFVRLKALEHHQRVHTGEQPVKCSHCEKNFCDAKSLLKHMKTVKHLQRVSNQEGQIIEIEKPFLCSKCGIRFYRQQSLFRHVEIIHSTNDNNILKCSHCDYKSKCKTNFKRHLELHTDVKRFVCEQCGSSFRALATLKEHYVFVHSENREFICDSCKKSFKNKSTLLRHMRIHSESRPYKCYCNRDYKRMSHLKRHMISAHQITLKKNQMPMNMKENTNLNHSLSDESVTALIKSLEALPDESSCDDFTVSHYIATLSTNCATALGDLNINGEPCEEQLPTKTGEDGSFAVPLNDMQKHSDNANNYAITEHLENTTNAFDLSQHLKLPLNSMLPSSETSSTSLDDNTLSLSPSNYCNNSSPIHTIPLENVTISPSIISEDMHSLASIDNIIQPQSPPTLNFQTSASNIDSLISLPLQSADSPDSLPISPFLPNDNMSSPSHMADLSLEQNSAQRHLFKDFLSLPSYAESSDFEAFSWDTDENSNTLKVSNNDLLTPSTCANIFSSSLTSNANNLLPNNLFANDLLDATALNSEFDPLSCLI